jgi:hypothetical protein
MARRYTDIVLVIVSEAVREQENTNGSQKIGSAILMYGKVSNLLPHGKSQWRILVTSGKLYAISKLVKVTA